MQYVFPITVFAALIFLLLLRVDIARINKLRKRCQREYENFLNSADSVFVSYGGDLSELGYRSRLLFDCALDSAEKIAAVHLILGAAISAMSSAEDDNPKMLENLRSDADVAIASSNLLEAMRKKTSSRWRNILANGQNLSAKDIDNAKDKLLKTFADKYGNENRF